MKCIHILCAQIALSLPPDRYFILIHFLLSDNQHIGNPCQLRISYLLADFLTPVIDLCTNIRIFQRFQKTLCILDELITDRQEFNLHRRQPQGEFTRIMFQ